jgi:hypothetical protein
MSIRLTEQQIDTALAWWSDKLGAGYFRDPDDVPSAESVFAFRLELSGLLHEPFEQYHDARLSVDYEPKGMLASAAMKAGISDRIWPRKTVMWFNANDHVSVRYGRGAPIETLLGDPQ